MNALQLIASRGADPTDGVIVSITRFLAGETYNVIPSQAKLSGTLRSLNEERRIWLREEVRRIAETTAVAHGLQANVCIHPGYPTTVNSKSSAQFAAAVARDISHGTDVLTGLPPSMGCEDFAYMLQERPGCYAWLGNGSAAEGGMLHSPSYDFNDDILVVGATYWASLAERRLAA